MCVPVCVPFEEFVGDENDLHHVCVKVGLYLVDKNLVHFYGNLL